MVKPPIARRLYPTAVSVCPAHGNGEGPRHRGCDLQRKHEEHMDIYKDIYMYINIYIY